MRAYTLTELMSLTRAELFALHRRIVDVLAQLPEGYPERLTALGNLRDIRRVLAGCEFAPVDPLRHGREAMRSDAGHR
jgi:hypothetical protein